MGRRLQLAGGAVVALTLVGVLIAVVAGVGFGGEDERLEGLAQVAVPPVRTTDLRAAAQRAGCALRTFPQEGRLHVDGPVRYRTNPPTSGDHFPVPAADRVYDPGDEPSPERLVHALEHGRIVVRYRPGTPRRRVDQLETWYAETTKGTRAYKTILVQDAGGMPYALAATAWTRALLCPRSTDAAFDALRTFRTAFVDRGPELVP